MTYSKATAIGLVAILMWSTAVGLIRTVAEALGAVGGAAMIYTLSSVVLLVTVGFPNLTKFPRRYLILGGLLFVVYELCLSLSVGFASTSKQAIEVSMVNYLWPSFTLVLALFVSGKRMSLMMFVGMIVCLCGVGKVLAGDDGFSLTEMGVNVISNPLSYGLAFSGAVIWSVYCVYTKKAAEGFNGITPFFMLTAVVLWGKFGLSENPAMTFSPRVLIDLVLVSCAMGLGYAAWNIGILHGNVTVLATASYFTPVLSALFAALLLEESLGVGFWLGASMVSIGSVICWKASKVN